MAWRNELCSLACHGHASAAELSPPCCLHLARMHLQFLPLDAVSQKGKRSNEVHE